MALVIRQAMIWQELERELPPGLDELRAFLDVLSQFDQEIVRELELERGHGRGDFPVGAMLNAFAAQSCLRHGKFSDLLAELRRNADLARMLGFEEVGPGQYRLPSRSAISRFHQKLQSDPWRQRLREVFKRSVEALTKEHPGFGENQALDASDLRSHARPPRRDPSDESGQKRIPSSDPEASWSVKTKTKKDGEGKVRKEHKATFGYKVYAATDVAIPGITAVEITTGSTSDQEMALPLLATAKAAVSDRLRTMAMDKGFDSEEIVTGAYKLGVAAIVPVRDVPQDLKDKPREDREQALVSGGNIVYDPYEGEVACYAPSGDGSSLQRRELTYAGFEDARKAHKFRCPLGAAAATQCPAFASCSAGSNGALGRQVRVPMARDPRRLAPIYPRSKHWRRRYRGRTSIERVNSYLKGVLRLEDHCLRGTHAMEVRALLGALVLNLRTLLRIRAGSAVAQAA